MEFNRLNTQRRLNMILDRNNTRHKDQKRLAEELGVHWTTVSRWANGRSPIGKWIGKEIDEIARRMNDEQVS